MKRNLKLVAGACAASLMAFSAVAQETPSAKAGGTVIPDERSTNGRLGVCLGRLEKASNLIGMEVQSYDGVKLGKVDELAVDLQSGRIVQVILSTGGFLGLFVTLVPVPPGALQADVTGKVLQLKADKSKLKAAPWYGMSNWADLGQSNQVVEIYRYHGQQPYFTAADETGRGADPTARLGTVQRTTKLMGAKVKNLQNETLGKVENLEVELSAGRVVAVILKLGGSHGGGEVLCAVPPASFQRHSGQGYLQLDASKEELARDPQFRAEESPGFDEPRRFAGFHRACPREPHFTTDETAEVDGAARFISLRDVPMPTAIARGTTNTDAVSTARIREWIDSEKGISLNTRNLKFTVHNSRVTSRRAFNAGEGRRCAGEPASRPVHSGNVDCQLEAKLASGSGQ